MGDAKGLPRLRKDARKLLPAIMPPRLGHCAVFVATLWAYQTGCFGMCRTRHTQPLCSHFLFWKALFASVGRCSFLYAPIKSTFLSSMLTSPIGAVP
ncbi:hypothetical protein B0H19DRAFT_1233512 [Mycena capillaripes]|nr:hypothetical protein B0H19DRAFT_1233512 [Mycena capillaripes]